MSSTSDFVFLFIFITTPAILNLFRREHNKKEMKEETSIISDSSPSAYNDLIGNTPLVKLRKLSDKVGCDIFVKMEALNPGGTGKDRAVKFMLNAAKHHCRFKEGVDIVEGTSGSTGIALAFQCNALGLKLHVVMPDDQADEKRLLLEKLGATVKIVPNCGIANENHYVNQARKLADEIQGIFIDQFENTANFSAHYETTGPEIWDATDGAIDAFVMSAGTGGTIAGVSRYLKEKRSSIKVVLADPTGSSLLSKVLYNACFTSQQSERSLRKHRYDTIVEGVGLDRVTRNFDLCFNDGGTTRPCFKSTSKSKSSYLFSNLGDTATTPSDCETNSGQRSVDFAVHIPDQEVINTAHWLLQHEGIFVGSSSALNIAAAIRTAKELSASSPWATDNINNSHGDTSPRRRPVVVTVVCDNGARHLSRFWNPEYLATCGLRWPDNTDLNNIFSSK